MNNIEFKELTPEELPAVLEIYNHYVLNSTATFHVHPLSLQEMKSLIFFDDPKYKTFVILSSGAICGYAYISRFKPREAYDGTAEATVYLKSEYTGRGIGAEAIRFMEQIAKEQNIHVLLAVITDGNNASIKAFEKNGFVKCAHYREVGRKFGQQLDVVAYQKILD